MTISDLEQLLCKEFTDCDKKQIELVLKANQAKLEKCLGYELCLNQNFYNEVNSLVCEPQCEPYTHTGSCPKVTITNEIYSGCNCFRDCYGQTTTIVTDETHEQDCPIPEACDKPLSFLDDPKLQLNEDCNGIKYRCYDFDPSRPFINVDPYIAICSVKITTCNTTIYELEDCDYENTNNGSINSSWYNSLKICSDCLPQPCYNPSFACCDKPQGCLKICVGAYWGFGLPTAEWDEVCDEDGNKTLVPKKDMCLIPDELTYVLLEMAKEELDCNRNMKSESLGSYSYTRFERESVLERHSDLLMSYAGPNSPKRQSPIIC